VLAITFIAVHTLANCKSLLTRLSLARLVMRQEFLCYHGPVTLQLARTEAPEVVSQGNCRLSMTLTPFDPNLEAAKSWSISRHACLLLSGGAHYHAVSSELQPAVAVLDD
jgi:hypothetical protein